MECFEECDVLEFCGFLLLLYTFHLEHQHNSRCIAQAVMLLSFLVLSNRMLP